MRAPRRIAGLALSVLLLGGVSSSGCVQRLHDRRDTKGANDKEFRKVVEKMAEAWESRETEQIAGFYHPAVFGQVLDEAPKTYTGDDDVRNDVKRLLAPIAELHVVLVDDIQVWKQGKKVWTLQPFHFQGMLKSGKPFQFDGRHSAIWEKHDKKWVIVYGHFLGPCLPETRISTS
ncbi:MAG: nuclear transport factor 2 family protein [Thermoanaerobaculia bacterium]